MRFPRVPRRADQIALATIGVVAAIPLPIWIDRIVLIGFALYALDVLITRSIRRFTR